MWVVYILHLEAQDITAHGIFKTEQEARAWQIYLLREIEPGAIIRMIQLPLLTFNERTKVCTVLCSSSS